MGIGSLHGSLFWGVGVTSRSSVWIGSPCSARGVPFCVWDPMRPRLRRSLSDDSCAVRTRSISVASPSDPSSSMISDGVWGGVSPWVEALVGLLGVYSRDWDLVVCALSRVEWMRVGFCFSFLMSLIWVCCAFLFLALPLLLIFVQVMGPLALSGCLLLYVFVFGVVLTHSHSFLSAFLGISSANFGRSLASRLIRVFEFNRNLVSFAYFCCFWVGLFLVFQNILLLSHRLGIFLLL